ncbi:hypothetical protein [Nocardioides sp. cx-173]|uniref:hypothetical protein n=1 Tax=Nocardioides sp. cx-173 TaxID=2898796 RepID=UPI001E50E009|nr:hypothetical protein [Nocardioides sp. cx-173]MCD4525095.1 hypothetical protein [Nocardioides sp. cx-173]UGB40202.1 hypothetical protein LQ940_12450 [Nocardioides sp. cx-173]
MQIPSSTLARALAFAAGLALVFGVALAAGATLGPVETEPRGHDDTHVEPVGSPATGSPQAVPGGLQSAQDGYRLVLADTRLSPGADRPVSFTIEGPEGAVTEYDVAHTKLLHLIAVRRDFEGFQHVHPTLATDGTWATTLDLTGGSWRVFADFTPAGGEPLTLGADLAVPGAAAAADPRPETRSVTVDGYTVTLTGDLVAGAHSELTLTVTRDGRPVSDLQPYLGAYGHLVALREGDLAYLHVHPTGEPGDGVTAPGPDVTFGVEVPSRGDYQLYLDFRHDGVVRTAHLALPASGSGHDGGGHDDGGHDDGGHGP